MIPSVRKESDDIVDKIRPMIISGGEGLREGAVVILRRYGRGDEKQNPVITQPRAQNVILGWAINLISKGRKDLAAKLLWGENVFTVRPRSVRMVWDSIETSSETMVQGGAALGKSYGGAGWFLLDWLQDPMWTAVKVISTSQEHAKRNVFAHIKNLHAQACVPLPGNALGGSIQVGKNDRYGIHLMTIPAGETGKGRLRGLHPAPRPHHARFGTLSRVRVLLDEAEEIPEGVWEDVDNLLSTKHGVEHIKIFGATNPKNRNSRFAQRCEPPDGWSSLSLETSEKWTSRTGADVIRLDGARCENVAEKRIVFEGLQTLEGYVRLLDPPDSPTYFTMARGWYPEQGLYVTAIPLNFLDRAKGELIFSGRVQFATATDLSFGGGDKCVLTVARVGNVIGWTPMGKAPIMFEQTDAARQGVQIDQQIEINKGKDTLEMVREIMRINRGLGVDRNLLAMDKTGAQTAYDLINAMYDPNGQGDVFGIGFGEKATDLYVLDDNSKKASDLYDGIVTELFFGTRFYIEFDYLKISPTVKMDPLARQLTDRRFAQAKGKLVRIESKKEYKKRVKNQESPDHADSLTMIVQLVRQRLNFIATMLAIAPAERTQSIQPGIVDQLGNQFMDFET